MDEPDRWRHLASGPKDGSRILVTIRPSEQGQAEVDLAYWSNSDQFGAEGWRASDSSPGRVVAENRYAVDAVLPEMARRNDPLGDKLRRC